MDGDVGFGEDRDPGHPSAVTEAMQVNVKERRSRDVHRAAHRTLDPGRVVEMPRAPEIEQHVGAGEDLAALLREVVSAGGAGRAAPAPGSGRADCA